MPLSQASLRNNLLVALSPDDFAATVPHLEMVDLELRRVLTDVDQPIEYVHFLEHGLASVVVISADGEVVEIGHVGREGMTGTAACLGVESSDTKTFMQVSGAATRMPFADFGALIEAHPSIRRLFLRYLYTLQVQVGHTALANARYSLRECLIRWILMSQDRVGTADLPLTHEFLSLMLGVRRAGVTDEVHILESMGLIKATRGNIRVLDRLRLVEIAGGCYGHPERIYEKLIGTPVDARTLSLADG